VLRQFTQFGYQSPSLSLSLSVRFTFVAHTAGFSSMCCIRARALRVLLRRQRYQQPFESRVRDCHSRQCARRRFDDGGTEGSPRATNFTITARHSSPFSRSFLLSRSRTHVHRLSHSHAPSFSATLLPRVARMWRGGHYVFATRVFRGFAIETSFVSFTVTAVAASRFMKTGDNGRIDCFVPYPIITARRRHTE